MKTLLHLLGATVLLLSSVYSQTPNELTKKYFEAFKAGEYAKVSKLIAPSELDEFRKGFKFAEELPEEKAKQFCSTFFGPEATLKSIKAMTDEDFYSSFMTSTVKMMGGGNEVKFENEEVLGEEIEGEKIARVQTKYKVTIGGKSVEENEVIVFNKINDKWMMMMPKSLKEAPAGIKAAFEQK